MKVITLRIEDELEVKINKILDFYHLKTVNKALVKMIENHLLIEDMAQKSNALSEEREFKLDEIKRISEEIEIMKLRLKELINS